MHVDEPQQCLPADAEPVDAEADAASVHVDEPQPGDAGSQPGSASQEPAKADAAIASSPAAPAVEDEQGSPSAAKPEAVDAKAEPVDAKPEPVDAKAEPVDAEPEASSVHDAEHRPPPPADAEPVPSFASAGSAELPPMPCEPLADWSIEDDQVNEDAFTPTDAFQQELDRPAGKTVADAVLNGMDKDEVIHALLPDWLRPAKERPETNSQLAEMQRMKETNVEHVRWRRIDIGEANPDVATVASSMKAEASQWVLDSSVPHVRNVISIRGTGIPGSARKRPR